MVRLTFMHGRDVFRGTEFQSWIPKLFPSAKFDGFMWGNWYPSINIPFQEFENQHKNIPVRFQEKIAGIQTTPNFLQSLSFGVYPINRITNLHPDFEKFSGRKNQAKKVEEIIDVPRSL